MQIKEISDKKEWEDFLSGEKPHTFLQSWNWGEFNKLMGERIWRFGIYGTDKQPTTNNRQLIGVALVIKIRAKRGTFPFVPHAPIFRKGQLLITNYQLLIAYLKNLAKQENCSFIRVSPIVLRTAESEKLFKDLGFRQAPIHMHAEMVSILDVAPSEEELLRSMRKTTRYLTRKAQNDGVQIIKSSDPRYLQSFDALYKETAERQHFTAYSENYLHNEFESFHKDSQVEIFLAQYRGEVVAGAMIIFYGDSGFYHQGASSNKYPKIPAPHLLQWEIIKEAKRRGLRYYNFWGIVPDEDKKHPWFGLSLFKKGFGGFSEEYLPAQDLVLEPNYWLTYFVEKLRKFRRGL